MNKRTPEEKAKVRERRNRMLDSAAAAELSLTEGVREMRAIAGMTQEEFAKHRGVSARIIKAIELGQGNPTVATLNRTGEFFGLEVAFVPARRKPDSAEQRPHTTTSAVPARAQEASLSELGMTPAAFLQLAKEVREGFLASLKQIDDTVRQLEAGPAASDMPATPGQAGVKPAVRRKQHRGQE